MFVRYALVSVLALSIDNGCYWLIGAHWGYALPLAAAMAYGCGAVVHYLLSRHWVFVQGWMHRHRIRELLAFVGTALLGTGLTYAVVLGFQIAGYEGWKMPKAFAVGVSFVAVYCCRKFWVFAPPVDGSAVEPVGDWMVKKEKSYS